jgi:formimidoylglutamate deiminase
MAGVMGRQNETIYRGRYILIDGRFEQDAALVERAGRIEKILRGDEAAGAVNAERRELDLGNVALIPGQLNVHSHAFQRSLRGKTEYGQPGREDDNFWTWRTEMYELANRIEPEEMEIIGRMVFLEMLRAGITHVGEFHYVHHQPDGTPYEEPNELALRLGKAAKAVGLRMTMLPVAYHTGDIGKEASPEQRRFISKEVDRFLNRVDRLAEGWSGEELLDVGVAPHSIRAVDRKWLEAIAEWGRSRKAPVHIHACEQRKEVRASQEAFGMPPVEALYEWGVLDEGWTIIHGTHLSERELEILAEVRPTIGACPTTERNLGDGFLPAAELVARDVPIALGSDSHTVVDPFEEMRLVEYHERLRREERNVLVGADRRGRLSTAEILWPMGTAYGARSLAGDDGEIREGGPADFVALDLDHPSIAGAQRSTLLTDVVLSMSAGAVRDVIVAGEAVVAEGFHRRQHEYISDYCALMERFANEGSR